MDKEIDDKQKRIILSWHKLSQENSDYYIKFIAEWIAFNAICYALYYKKALKIPAEIVRDKKYEKIIVDSESGVPLPAEEAYLLREENNSRISIKFFKEHNQILELKIGDKRYIEKMIFDQFASNYSTWYESDDSLKKNFDKLKDSLKKDDGFYYVIKMADIDAYNEFVRFGNYTEEDLEKSKTVVFCKENKLGVVKDVLYQIRCNIFHGEKIPGELNDDRIVQAAFPLLNAIVDFLISNLNINDNKFINKNISMNNPIKEWLTEETVMNLALVKGMIVLGESDNFKKEWGGAGIIVTSDKDDKRKADIKIVTKHAKHISFLLEQLKDVFKKYIDYSNKREFYSYVVNLIDKEELEQEDDSKKVLINMIDKLIALEKKD